MFLSKQPAEHSRAVCHKLRALTGHEWYHNESNPSVRGSSFRCTAPTSVDDFEREKGAAYVVHVLRKCDIDPIITHTDNKRTQIVISRKQADLFLNSAAQNDVEAAARHHQAPSLPEVIESDDPLTPHDLKQMREALALLVEPSIAKWFYNAQHKHFVVSLPNEKAATLINDFKDLDIFIASTSCTNNDTLIEIDANPWNAEILAQRLAVDPQKSVYVKGATLEKSLTVQAAPLRS
jgi:hypothetical protein